MSEEPSTETQAGTGAAPKIPPPGEAWAENSEEDEESETQEAHHR